jgi:hypothetical protein
MRQVPGGLLALLLLALAGCTASDDGRAGWVQPAFAHYNSTYDGYDDDFGYGGPGYWPGYYYPSHDYWAHRHFRRHHRPDGGLAFSPHRGVTCNPRAQACFGEDGLDREWTDTVFGDAPRRETQSRADGQRISPQPEGPEDASRANGLGMVKSDVIERMQRRSVPDPIVVPQPRRQEQPQFQMARPGADRSNGAVLRMPRTCAGAACR